MKTPYQWLTQIKKYFTSSISSKIITPYFLLTLVFTAFGVFVVTQLVVIGLEERLKNQLVGAGRVVSEEIVNRENLRLEVERFVANTEDVPEAIVARDLETLNDLVSPYILNSNDIDSIVIVDTQNREMLRLQRAINATSSDPIQTVLGSAVSYENWSVVAKVLADPDGVKEVQFGRDTQTDELIIYTVGPVRSPDGVIGAVLVGTYLRKEMRALSSLALADIILFNKNSRVIDLTLVLDQDEPLNEVFAVFTPERFQEVINGTENRTLLDEVRLESQAETYRLAYVPFILRGEVNGVYAVALPTNFITEQDSTSRNRLIFIFSFGIAAVFGVGYLVSNWIVQPILQLVNTSQAIAKGDLSQRTGLRRNDEIGILANTFDNMTTELQKKTIELEEEASKLTAILSSIADGVLVQDLEGNIIRMNPAARQILADIGGNLSNLDQSGTTMAVDETFSKTEIPLLNDLTGLEFHETQRFEVERRVLSAISAPVVTSENEQLGSVVVLRDITREVEAERLKDNFITSVSHELRTPLTAIKGYNELLRMTAADQLDDRQRDFTEHIEDNVSDLLNLIQMVLDISQIEAGTLGTDQEPIDLAELIKVETEQWVDKMADKGLTFTVHLSGETSWVEGDWQRLTRVVHNLIDNAYNYTLSGGEVNVRLRSENGQAEVHIIDTGVGIAKEDQRFLFTRFFRAIHEDHGEEIHEVSGAGLGLYMSKAIIEAHNGNMWVESDLHQGSKFFFTIPIMEGALEEVDPKAIDFIDTRPMEKSEL